MSSQVVPAQPGSGPVTPPVTGVAPPVQPAAQRSLRSLAIRGAAWTVVGYGASQVLRLGSNLILTRLLFPEAFGLMALVSVVLTGLQMFSDVGIGPSIIQNKRGEDPRFLNTAWTIQVFRGFALWIACSILAWPVALFYAEPQLLDLLPVAGLTAVIAGFNSPALALANRKLALGRLTLLELGTQIITLVVMVVWAWVWPSVWALLAGTLLGSVLKMAGTHVWLGGGRVRLHFESEVFRELVGFGKWLTMSSALSFIVSGGDRLIYGKAFGLEFVGIYAVALAMSLIPEHIISTLGSRVLFPALSKAKNSADGNERFKRAFHRARLTLGLVGVPLCGAIAASGREIVALLYDPRYQAAGWILELLVLRVALACVTVPGTNALLALGQSSYIFRIAFARSAWFAVAVAPAAFLVNEVAGISAFVCGGLVSTMIIQFGLWRRGLASLRVELTLAGAGVVAYGAVEGLIIGVGAVTR